MFFLVNVGEKKKKRKQKDLGASVRSPVTQSFAQGLESCSLAQTLRKSRGGLGLPPTWGSAPLIALFA